MFLSCRGTRPPSKVLTALALAATALACPVAAQESSSTNDANNPLTPKVKINFHDYYVPSLTDLDDR